MTKRKLIFLWVGAGFAFICVYLWFFGIQTAFALQAWNTGRKIPEVKDVPLEIQDTSVNAVPGAKLSYSGYSFEVPWTDLDQSQSKIAPLKQILVFRSGVRLLVTTAPPRNFVGLVAKQAGGENILRQEYGEEVVSSDYNFFVRMLNTTPESVSPFGSREAAVRNSTLLVIKAIAMPEPGRSGIYSFHTGSFQGFQFGSPGNSKNRVSSDLYDENGGFEFIFMDRNGQPPHIRQADINRVTQSLARIPAFSAGTAVASKVVN